MSAREIVAAPELIGDPARFRIAPTPGELVARVMTTAWRARPEPLVIDPEDFVRALPLLLPPSGLSALAWWRFRHTSGSAPMLDSLAEARGLVASQAFLHRRDLVRAVTRLRAAGVEAVLVKGWAIARFYPDPHMRPSSDLDLCVRHADYGQARRVLADGTGVTAPIDLHRGFGTLDEGTAEGLFERSRLADCDGTPVRVLAPEDHLRVLCYHLLRHGVSRALWLCDVALAVETRPRDFDWTQCLGPERRVADWITSAIGLAHCLLGARIDDTPLRDRARQLPSWLVSIVLREWEREHRVLAPLADHLRRPARLLAEASRHWPNGIRATVELRRPLNEWPRLPHQIAASLRGAGRFLRRVAGPRHADE
jgi:putative nucleotidyltransferase-like protein